MKYKKYLPNTHRNIKLCKSLAKKDQYVYNRLIHFVTSRISDTNKLKWTQLSKLKVCVVVDRHLFARCAVWHRMRRCERTPHYVPHKYSEWRLGVTFWQDETIAHSCSKSPREFSICQIVFATRSTKRSL